MPLIKKFKGPSLEHATYVANGRFILFGVLVLSIALVYILHNTLHII